MYLLDASALYPLLRRIGDKILLYRDELAVLDLTFYEIGNVLWKEYRLGRIRDWRTISKLFSEVLKELQVLRVENLEGVLEIATERNLSFYDASYAYMAEKENLVLVTEDKKLLRSTSNSIGVKELLARLDKPM